MVRTETGPGTAHGLLTASFLQQAALWKSGRLKYSVVLESLSVLDTVSFLREKARKYFPLELGALQKALADSGPCAFMDEFVSCIHKHGLFPVNEFPCEELDSWIFSHIPLCMMGFDPETMEVEAWDTAVLVIQDMTGEYFYSDQATIWDILEKRNIETNYASGTFKNLNEVQWEQADLSGDWKFLPALIKRATYSTEHPLLDWTETGFAECSDCPSWEEFDDCVEEWKKAKILLDQTQCLLEWIRADEVVRIRQMIEIIKGAANAVNHP